MSNLKNLQIPLKYLANNNIIDFIFSLDILYFNVFLE